MVNLTRIYTRTGDAGSTRLSDNSEASKTDLRVEAYGDVDEANSTLGIVLALGVEEPLAGVLREVQNELFDVGADLSTPYDPNPEWPPLRIEAASIERLEAWCDEFSAALPDLRSFILPAGAPAIVRRAERTAWRAAEVHGLSGPDAAPGGMNPLAITYLNRLSDLLFIASRVANGTDHEVLWVPGKDRAAPSPRAQAQRDRITESQR